MIWVNKKHKVLKQKKKVKMINWNFKIQVSLNQMINNGVNRKKNHKKQYKSYQLKKLTN